MTKIKKEKIISTSYDISFAEEVLRCIIARIDGEWDNPYLKAFGLLSTDLIKDIRLMATKAIENERNSS